MSLLVNKCKQLSGKIEIGDVVLVGVNNLKRIYWPMGLVIDLMPGPDGYIRVVKVETISGEFIITSKKLYLLEIK